MPQDYIVKLLGDWSNGLGFGAVLLKLSLAFILAMITGIERATKRHAAGLRTFVLVSLVSTLASMCDEYIIERFGVQFSFVTAATVIGIAILSSNTILYSSKSQLKGVTTSVALWGISVISIFIGFGHYTIALCSFLIYIVSIAIFPNLETYFKMRSNHFEIHLELKGKNHLTEFIETIRRLGLKIDDIEINPAYANSGLAVYTMAMTIVSKELRECKTHDEIVNVLKELDYVNYIDVIL
ncbi:MAG: MgtC/SapB family protein [Clostridiales bacterium]|nr:MgtC/SapB family protein [Clostridiales bacterium]